jgi:aminopeptidase N
MGEVSLHQAGMVILPADPQWVGRRRAEFHILPLPGIDRNITMIVSKFVCLRNMKIRQSFLLTAIICLGWASPSGATRPGAGVDILSHAVAITPDFETKSVSGRDRIRLRVEQDQLREITFSNNALIVDAATLNGRSAAIARRDGMLVFSPALPLRKGEVATLSVSYHGTPAHGLTFVGGSVFTSYGACDWMICSQDMPGDKASIAISLSLPTGMNSLAVGRLQYRKAQASGRTIHQWRESRPYSSYLYGFAAGPLVETAARQHGYELTRFDATGSRQDVEALFGTTAEMVSFLEDKAGIPLPRKRYAQLLVPGGEAQELATYSVIGISQIEPILKDPQQDWVLIHELAHQWWGNLITCKNWDHFWLNEGFAVFMTAAWKEHQYGRAAYDAELDGARARVVRARQRGEDRPLAYSGRYSSLRTRRAIQYSKGALFLDHLRGLVGEKAFWAGIKLYTRAHAGGIVESRDFERALEKASGRDLSAPFDEWVYETP